MDKADEESAEFRRACRVAELTAAEKAAIEKSNKEFQDFMAQKLKEAEAEADALGLV